VVTNSWRWDIWKQDLRAKGAILVPTECADELTQL
jgi:hypothetical protein